ncbi:hypothetical protein SALBM311S_00118 [Streptomyces alboniger]
MLQATQHSDDWEEAARDLLRVMKPGRRIVLAESVLKGPTFTARINSDVHLRQWFDKLFQQVPVADIPYWSGEEVREAFGDTVDSPQLMEWRGIEMFWGRKNQPAAPIVPKPRSCRNSGSGIGSPPEPHYATPPRTRRLP